jgi:CelD/BcsL family acetyltransferase involved in cellulose biosynthesis
VTAATGSHPTHVVEGDLADAALRVRYEALFDRCPGAFVQQSTDWADVIRNLGPDRPVLLLARDNGVDVAGLPLYRFDGRFGPILTSVPQPGPLGGVFAAPELDSIARDRVYAALLRAAGDLARRERALALTVITNPFAPDRDLYERHLAPDFVFETFTQFVPLDTVADGRIPMADSKRRNDLRRHLRRAADAGLTARDAIGDTEADLDRWMALHARRQREIGAAPLPRLLFANIRERLVPRGKAHVVVVMAGGDIASAMWLVRHRDVVDAFIVSMDSRYGALAPNWLAAARAVQWARETGARIFNWQSSPTRGDGVYAFKRQWGSLDVPYCFVTRLFVPPEDVLTWGLDDVAAAYPRHFVVPFGFFTTPGERRFTK